MQKFQNMEHSNSRTFQGLSRTSEGPYEPCDSERVNCWKQWRLAE